MKVFEEPLKAYQQMIQQPSYLDPIAYEEIKPEDYDGFIFGVLVLFLGVLRGFGVLGGFWGFIRILLAMMRIE